VQRSAAGRVLALACRRQRRNELGRNRDVREWAESHPKRDTLADESREAACADGPDG
jgi:hypothetical protein